MAASEKGIGRRRRGRCAGGGDTYVVPRLLGLPILIDLLGDGEGALDAIRRAAKGGIEHLGQAVHVLPGEPVGLAEGQKRSATEDRQLLGGDQLRHRDGVRMIDAVPHRHLGQDDDDRQAGTVQIPDEFGLGLLETPIHSAHTEPGHVQLLGQRPLAHVLHRLGQLGDDLLVVTADLEALGVDDAEVADLVQVEVAALSHRLADPGPGHLLTEDRVDQRGFTDPGLAEDRQIEPAERGRLPLVLALERIAEPVVAGHAVPHSVTCSTT